jgi:uncharacterized protein (TIGR03437 family)
MLLRTFCLIFLFTFPPLSAQTPTTGQPGLPAVDTVMIGLLAKYQIPGAALAISVNGKLVYARGYGYADTSTKALVQPDSIFRQASLSKPFTALAILELVDQGKVGLDQPAFSYLADLQPAASQITDSRIAQITVRDCLNHTGGWDRTVPGVGDPVANSLLIAQQTGAPLPGSMDWFVRYIWTQPLQHAPATVGAYSNIGYVVLGSIIEHVTGMRYEDYVRQKVLLPLGIQRAFLATDLSDTPKGEVTYYPYPGEPCVQSLIPYHAGCFPAPYANSDFEVAAATGGWATTPIELMRFLNGVPSLISAATLTQMQTAAPAFAGQSSFYGLGFSMKPDTGGFSWAKDGTFEGTSSFLFRRPNGFAWAVVFNMRPEVDDTTTSGDEGGPFEEDFLTQLSAVLEPPFPTADLFSNYASTLLKPQINAVVQSATGTPGVVSGSWVTIYGQNLSADSRLWFPSEFAFNGDGLPAYVDHVEAAIDGAPAAIHYVSPGQVNLQAPAGLNVGPVTVTLTHDGQTATFQAQAATVSPGFFTYPAGAFTFVAALHSSDSSTVGVTALTQGARPAVPGEILEVYGSGFAASPAGRIVGSATALPGNPVVTIGGVTAQATQVFLTGAGLFQINVTVPNVPAGNQPISVTYGGITSPTNVLIPITGS